MLERTADVAAVAKVKAKWQVDGAGDADAWPRGDVDAASGQPKDSELGCLDQVQSVMLHPYLKRLT